MDRERDPEVVSLKVDFDNLGTLDITPDNTLVCQFQHPYSLYDHAIYVKEVEYDPDSGVPLRAPYLYIPKKWPQFERIADHMVQHGYTDENKLSPAYLTELAIANFLKHHPHQTYVTQHLIAGLGNKLYKYDRNYDSENVLDLGLPWGIKATPGPKVSRHIKEQFNYRSEVSPEQRSKYYRDMGWIALKPTPSAAEGLDRWVRAVKGTDISVAEFRSFLSDVEANEEPGWSTELEIAFTMFRTMGRGASQSTVKLPQFMKLVAGSEEPGPSEA